MAAFLEKLLGKRVEAVFNRAPGVIVSYKGIVSGIDEGRLILLTGVAKCGINKRWFDCPDQVINTASSILERLEIAE